MSRYVQTYSIVIFTAIVLITVLILNREMGTNLYGQSFVVPTPNYPVHPEDQHWLEKLQDLPYSAEPRDDAPALRPDPAFAAQNPEEIAKIVGTPMIIAASGLETAGNKIWVTNKEIQLPKNIYIDALIISGFCEFARNEDGTYQPLYHCARTPYYVLKEMDSGLAIRVESDGQVYMWQPTENSLHLAQETFQFVFDILGGTLQPDMGWEIDEKSTVGQN